MNEEVCCYALNFNVKRFDKKNVPYQEAKSNSRSVLTILKIKYLKKNVLNFMS